MFLEKTKTLLIFFLNKLLRQYFHTFAVGDTKMLTWDCCIFLVVSILHPLCPEILPVLSALSQILAHLC